MPKEKKFHKKTEKYIETGSFEGYSIQLALDSGFSEVYSIELFDSYYRYCVDRFKNDPRVHLICGDSSIELEKLLKTMPNTPFTFWLDAHTGDTTPIMHELELVLSRNVNNELIYIDDMRLYKNFNEHVNIEAMAQLIYKYKPHAKISYEDDIWSEDDILIIDY